LYGGIWKQYENLVYFRKVKEYTDQLWQQFTTQGYIECPVSQYRFERDKLEEMNPQKLLNYVLQNFETATNVKLMWKIFKTLRGKNTKLVLSVYDSFLFDVDESETDVMPQIVEIFKQHHLNVKTKVGNTYNFK
jgi:DNA polymerase I-like protein with 3'-5' exonuclease and polymerase domains